MTPTEERGKAYTDTVTLREEHRADPEALRSIEAMIEPWLVANEALDPRILCTHPAAVVDIPIPLGTKPVWISCYNLPRTMEEKMHEHFVKGIENRTYEPARDDSRDRWNVPIIGVAKKNDKGVVTEVRPCMDLRQINNKFNVHETCDMITPEGIFQKLQGASIFSEIDLVGAYNQLRVKRRVRKYLSFTWRGRRLRCRASPFGLKHSGAVLISTLSAVLEPECLDFTTFYLDNIIVFSKSAEEHKQHLVSVLSKLTAHHLRVKRSKSKIAYTQACVLGHMVSGSGRSPDPSKLSTLHYYPRPTTRHEMVKYLSFVGYLRAYVPNFAAISAPLNAWRASYNCKNSKRSKQERVVWTDMMCQAFVAIRLVLSSAPVLRPPRWDRPFHVACDASKYGLGAVLYQIVDDRTHYISFASRILTKAQTRYSATRRELLSVVFALMKFRPWVWGTRFTLYTDHAALIHWSTTESASKHIVDWLDVLQEYDFDIVHLPGAMNHLPDALSRLYPEWVRHPGIAIELTCAEPKHKRRRRGDAREPRSAIVAAIRVDDQPRQARTIARNASISTTAKLLVPPEQRRDCVRKHHELGHYGTQQTLQQILKTGLWWPNMQEDIEKAVSQCDTCLRFVVKNQGFHPMRHINAAYPFDHIAIDLAEPTTQTTDRGNNFVLVVVDVCTRFVILRAIVDKSARTVGEELWKIFADFGIPTIIQSDNGTEFRNRLTEQMAGLLGIDHRFILPRHPQANGVVERQVGLTKGLVFKLLQDHQSRGSDVQWDRLLPAVQLALNIKIVKPHKSSPAELMFARPRSLGTAITDPDVTPMSEDELIRRNNAMIDIVYPEALNSTKRYQLGYGSERKRHLVAESEFTVGTTVMKKRTIRSKKSEPLFDGPYVITGVGEGWATLLNKQDNTTLSRNVPFRHLKWVAPPKNDTQPDSDVYTVQEVLDHKVQNREMFYLTHWMNYPKGDATWEPKSNFLDTSTIKEYWQKKYQLSTAKGERQAKG